MQERMTMKLDDEYITRPERLSNGKIIGDKTLRNKLGMLEDKQELGLLYEFPCKPGDTLYRIATDESADSLEIEPCTIDNIVICKNGDILFKYDAYDGVICHLENLTEGTLYLDTYKVFFTEEQAKKYIEQRRWEEL